MIVNQSQFFWLCNHWSESSRCGKVNATHHFLYNLIRQCEPTRGFQGISNPSKLMNSRSYHAFENAVKMFKIYATIATLPGNSNKSIIENFLKPFGGVVTAQHLIKLYDIYQMNNQDD